MNGMLCFVPFYYSDTWGANSVPVIGKHVNNIPMFENGCHVKNM